jgi:hypothetical protein
MARSAKAAAVALCLLSDRRGCSASVGVRGRHARPEDEQPLLDAGDEDRPGLEERVVAPGAGEAGVVVGGVDVEEAPIEPLPLLSAPLGTGLSRSWRFHTGRLTASTAAAVVRAAREARPSVCVQALADEALARSEKAQSHERRKSLEMRSTTQGKDGVRVKTR